MTRIELLCAVLDELEQATKQHGPMRSAHEGYAVLHEEVDELWDEVKKRHRINKRMREEAIQIAAMAMRFVLDVCLSDTESDQPTADLLPSLVVTSSGHPLDRTAAVSAPPLVDAIGKQSAHKPNSPCKHSPDFSCTWCSKSQYDFGC